MKTKNISYTLMAILAAGALSACGENAWNNHLDGFEEQYNQPIANVQTIEYTLTDADYSAIAANATNKQIAGEDQAAALAAVGSKKAFSEQAKASVYVPAFLGSTSFPYFTLTDGSAVKLTYNFQNPVPEVVSQAIGAKIATVTGDFYYEEVWADDNFIEAFSPSHPASQYIPAFLSDYVAAEDGDVCVVTYREADTDPVFGGGGSGSEPEGPVEIFAESFTESLGQFTIENASIPDNFDYIWSWGGSNYGAKATAYKDGASFASDSYLISPVIDLRNLSDITMTFEHVFNKFPSLEFAVENCTLVVREEGSSSWTKVEIPEHTDNTSWTFGTSGTIDLSAFAGKKIQFAFRYVSKDGESGTWEVKNLTMTGTAAARSSVRSHAPAQGLTLTPVAAAYTLDKGTWKAADYVVLQPGTYAEMGQSYNNLSTAEPYLSTYLASKFPYAADGTVKNVLWLHYAGGSTSYDCSQYVLTDGAWTANTFVEQVTEQFVHNGGKWMYNPNVTITLPAGRNQPLSTLYFQACVDWVYENICVPLGDNSITSGQFYVSKYGNNEYYSGTSAYQGNIDLRPDAARTQYPAEYGSMTDDQIVDLEKERFMTQVMPGALARLHPDATPIEGLEVLYTINFAVYTGTTTSYTAVFKVVGPGKFEPVSCTWDAE